MFLSMFHGKNTLCTQQGDARFSSPKCLEPHSVPHTFSVDVFSFNNTSGDCDFDLATLAFLYLLSAQRTSAETAKREAQLGINVGTST